MESCNDPERADETTDPVEQLPAPPQPVKDGHPVLASLALVAAAGLAGALLVGTSTPTLGATQSARIRWQERQRQIDADLACEKQPPADGHEQRTEQ